MNNPLRSLAWPALLVVLSALGSVLFACAMPFVGLAAICAATLKRTAGMATLTACWLAHEAMGYGLLGFPVDAYSLGWGAAILGASLIAFAIVRSVGGQGPVLSRLAIAAVLAFAGYEAALFAFAHIVGGTNTFTPTIVGGLAANDAIWLAVFVVLNGALARLVPGWFVGKRLRIG